MLTNPDAARFPHHHQPPRQPRFHVPGRPPYLIIHRLAHGPSLAHPTTAHFGFRHQTGRHRPRNDAPYAKPLNDRLGPGGPPSRNGQPTLAERMGRGGSRVAATLNPRRLPEGTPPILKQREGAERREAQSKAHAKLNEKLGSEEMKQWIRSRQIAPGVMDMSVSIQMLISSFNASSAIKLMFFLLQRLAEDAWLRDQGILPPGHADAPNNAGTVFWRLIDTVIQMASLEWYFDRLISSDREVARENPYPHSVSRQQQLQIPEPAQSLAIFTDMARSTRFERQSHHQLWRIRCNSVSGGEEGQSCGGRWESE